MLLAHRLTSEGLEIADDPTALEGALWVDVVDPSDDEVIAFLGVVKRAGQDFSVCDVLTDAIG